MNLTHLSLFTGIGGIDIAAEKAGFTTVGQCEIGEYQTRVLEKHWPLVPRWSDINDLSAKSFRDRTGIWKPTIISGGFPCQPHSVAGKRKGENDSRDLWSAMFRIIKELAPCWVLCENVSGILSTSADRVCKDLECAGYSIGIFNYDAAVVGAQHRRERVFFVAQADKCNEFTQSIDDLSDTNDWGDSMWGVRQLEEIKEDGGREHHNDRRAEAYEQGRWWKPEPGLGGVVDGLPSGLDRDISFQPEPNIPRTLKEKKNRVERLNALGNAVVPAQIYPILKAIAEVEVEKEGIKNVID